MKTLCPQCKHKIDIPKEYIGKEVKCSNCENVFEFSAPEELCENCGCIIGDMEQACVFRGRIVCPNCDKKLRSESKLLSQKSEADTVQVNTQRNRIPHCQLCGGSMAKKTVSSGNVPGIVLGLLVLAVGLFLTFGGIFCGGWIIGIPLCVLALFMGGKRKKVWKCQECGATFDRA